MKQQVIIDPHWNLEGLEPMILMLFKAVIIDPHWNLESSAFLLHIQKNL